MKVAFHSLSLVVAAGLGLLIGFAWRGKMERRFNSPPQARTEITTRSDNALKDPVRSGRNLTVTPARDDSPLATQLARDLSMSSDVTRWLYWLEGIEKASLADFPHLARLAKGDATATRLLALRWVQLDMRHLFNTLSTTQERRGFPAEDLAEVLFEEWPRRDPDAAIAALCGTNNFGTRELSRFHVAGFLVEKDPERGLRALSEWGMDNFAPRMTGVAKWAAAAPRHAAEVTLNNPAGYTSELALEAIGKEWVKTDPARALEFAVSKPGELAAILASTVLKSWAKQNLEHAANWLAGADAATRHRLSPAFVEAWAQTDANRALAWCEANLTGNCLAQTVGGVVNNAAQRDLPGTAGFVTEMKPSAARAEAAAVVAKNWFPGWRSGKPVPPAAIAWMAGLDAASTRRALEQVQWKWSNGDPRSMAEFLATAGSDSVPASADLNLARALARENPSAAFAWAGRLPTERGVAAGREAFAEWRRSQPESAMKWLNDLPSSDPRREAFLRKETNLAN